MEANKYYLYGTILVFQFFTSSIGQAQNACAMRINVNDSKAVVFVDGVPTSKPPVDVACKENPQTITVSTADGQIFSRKMPTLKNFGDTDREWNVFFLPKNAGGSHAETLKSHLLAQKTQDDRILNELVQIRVLIEKLAQKDPTIKKSLDRIVRKSRGRKIASAWAGPYVQLHSLARPNIETESVKSEFPQHMPKAGGAVLKFCSWQKKRKSQTWTRVVVGPFENEKEAQNFANAFGNKSFVVNKLGCRFPVASDLPL